MGDMREMFVSTTQIQIFLIYQMEMLIVPFRSGELQLGWCSHSDNVRHI